jgi:hypothetical protein
MTLTENGRLGTRQQWRTGNGIDFLACSVTLRRNYRSRNSRRIHVSSVVLLLKLGDCLPEARGLGVAQFYMLIPCVASVSATVEEHCKMGITWSEVSKTTALPILSMKNQ